MATYAHSMTSNPLRSLNWTYGLVGVADATLLPFIPLLLVERGLSAATIGLVLGIASTGSFVVGLAWAYLADRRLSPERLVVLAGVSAAMVAALLAINGGELGAALVIVALSVVRAPLMLLDPIALRRLRQAKRTDYARIRLRTSAGWAASAVASGAVLQSAGLRLVPFLYAPLSALLGLWVWRSLKPTALTPEPDTAGAPRARMPRIPLALVGFLGSCFLLGVSLAATQNFLVLQINVLGGGALLVGAAAAFQATTEVPTMAYINLLADRFGHRVLFAAGCAIYLVTFIAWAYTSNALVAALLKLVVGVAFALTFVAAVIITSELTPAHLRATGQALMKAVLFGIAPILGSLGGGLVYERLGPRVMFLAATVVVAAAGAVALISVPGRARVPDVAAAATPEPAPATP